MSTIARTAALTAPLTANGMTVDELLAFHKARFGDARMDATGDGTDGGDATTTDGGDSTATDTKTDATKATGDTKTADTATWNPDAWDGKVDSLPAGAQKIITDLRKADGDERVAKKTLDAIMAAINPEKDGEKPDPVKLAAQLTDSQRDGRQTKVELAVYKTASKHSGDPDALLDSRAFLAKVADLDPSADDFQSKVDAAIKSAVADNPKLKAARAAGASGADRTGGSGERAAKPKTLEDAITQKMAR
ncbi:hypothetical protein [Intrasporangium flavum]|uniref:hypothetical protein n=1 Tax=Intrasporangium flavum TaxID=1428657 RepID=UPI00096C9FBE|nr:hypothetical protein [Intrasporangium flavum]